MNFKKMHGLGNDFVILDFRTERQGLDGSQITQICDRHHGIGCDQLVVIEPSDNADIRAIFYNADGSESGACGNASRCVADIIMNEQGLKACTIETGGGVLEAHRAGENLITVNMGAPKHITDLDLDGAPVGVDMGNPHCVFFVEDVETVPVKTLGPKIENHPLFPERTNVEFVEVLEDGRLRQRTWERGGYETLACGSGACAVAVAAIRRELIEGQKVEIILNGGTLNIEWSQSDNMVYMTGPVTYVFEGQIF